MWKRAREKTENERVGRLSWRDSLPYEEGHTTRSDGDFTIGEILVTKIRTEIKKGDESRVTLTGAA